MPQDAQTSPCGAPTSDTTLEAQQETSPSKETVMMHHEFQAARQAALLTRAAQRRLVREAQQANKAARNGADSTLGTGSRKLFFRVA
ncbi:hypothetical protein JW613_08525 [Streptomyces smyrnaeus]|uniref:Uncharacterized protein n=2 Tax=Streptomyces smyrnaeus TaxID=1387713 RepID=A0ABS3XSH4_9ACTN|nr:hypothetical protein [Streptomyces smyrnaeus]MBO8198350.1 hypothetical protein [Streptomyces smyrnaeus]